MTMDEFRRYNAETIRRCDALLTDMQRERRTFHATERAVCVALAAMIATAFVLFAAAVALA